MRASAPRTHILPFPVAPSRLAQLEQIKEQNSAAVENDDVLAVFYANLDFHQPLFGPCGNVCLIDTIRTLEQKVCGIRFYTSASPEALNRANRDHSEMIAVWAPPPR